MDSKGGLILFQQNCQDKREKNLPNYQLYLQPFMFSLEKLFSFQDQTF